MSAGGVSPTCPTTITWTAVPTGREQAPSACAGRPRSWCLLVAARIELWSLGGGGGVAGTYGDMTVLAMWRGRRANMRGPETHSDSGDPPGHRTWLLVVPAGWSLDSLAGRRRRRSRDYLHD